MIKTKPVSLFAVGLLIATSFAFVQPSGNCRSLHVGIASHPHEVTSHSDSHEEDVANTSHTHEHRHSPDEPSHSHEHQSNYQAHSESKITYRSTNNILGPTPSFARFFSAVKSFSDQGYFLRIFRPPIG